MKDTHEENKMNTHPDDEEKIREFTYIYSIGKYPRYILEEDAIKLMKEYADHIRKKTQNEMVEEIQKIADTTPPNLLLNEIVNRFYRTNN
jgi:hypothetical protein